MIDSSQLTEEQQAFRERVRAWLADTAPTKGWVKQPGVSRRRVAKGDVAAIAANRECQRALYDAGFAGLSWPSVYGGQGLSVAEQIIFNDEARAYDLPLVVYIIGHGMCGPTLLSSGTEEQKQRFIPPMLSGDEIWCQLFSEPGAGSDVASLTTRAVHDGDGWVINGQKVWTSGADYCQYGILLARTDATVPKHRGLTMFILDLASPGVTVRPIRQMDGGEHFYEVFLDNVRIPDDRVLGEVGHGWQVATTTLMNERVALGAIRPLDDVPSVADLRDLADHQGLGDDPTVVHDLTRLWIQERIVGLIAERVIATLIRGRAPGPEGSTAKLVRTRFSDSSAQVAAELAGSPALAWDAADPRGDRWAQNLLFVPTLSVAGGTDEILKTVLAERVLGLPKEPIVKTEAKA